MRVENWIKIVLLAAGLLAFPAQAEKAEVGVLRYVSSGGLFIAVDKGYFKEEGIDVELKYFEAAQAIAMAVVSGDADFGVTALTAGFYNLAGKGALKIIAAQGQEKKGFDGNLVLASNAAYEKGLTTMDRLAGKTVGITQIGSSFHYQMGRIAAVKGFDLKTVQLKPLQSLPNMMAAVKSGQVDAIIVASHLGNALVAAGEAKEIGRVADVADYQYGGLFTATKTIAGKEAFVGRFARAYRKGAAEYARTLLKKDAAGKRRFDTESEVTAKIIAKYVYPSEPPETAAKKVLAAAFYVEPRARIDPDDIATQISWLKEQGLVDAGVEARNVLDLRFQADMKQ